MTTEGPSRQRALSTIEISDLSYPNNRLLERFLEDSADPNVSARYLFGRCPEKEGCVDFAEFLSDWKTVVSSFKTLQLPSPDNDTVSKVKARDGDKCIITGLQSSFFDPLVVTPIPRIDVSLTKPQLETLQVFLGSDCYDFLSNTGRADGPQNYLLVRRSAALAFSQGYFRFKFSRDPNYSIWQVLIGGSDKPSIIDKIPMTRRGCFKDYSESGTPCPDKYLLEVFSRFAKAISWYRVSTDIALKEQKPPTVSTKASQSLSYHISECGAVIFSSFCRLMPSRVRGQIYLGLWRLGAHLYGLSSSFNVQRLPFGMYLKKARQRNDQSLVSEYGALQSLRRLTHVPVPRPLDLVSGPDTSYLLTTRLPGYPVGSCLDAMSDGEVDAFIHELQGYLRELRAIPKQVGMDYAICNAVGGPCYDYRMIAGQDYDEAKGDLIEPFETEDDFNQKLQTPALPGVAHKSGHEIVFTHGDINMRNILMHNGRISGIVDWENSGWFPDYWEYTKALFVTRVHRRWLRIMDRVFPVFGDFKDDLDTERQLWEYCM